MPFPSITVLSSSLGRWKIGRLPYFSAVSYTHLDVYKRQGQDPEVLLCSLANFEVPLSKEQLKKLYKNSQDYAKKVAQRYDELVKQGWALPMYREMVVSEASRVTF